MQLLQLAIHNNSSSCSYSLCSCRCSSSSVFCLLRCSSCCSSNLSRSRLMRSFPRWCSSGNYRFRCFAADRQVDNIDSRQLDRQVNRQIIYLFILPPPNTNVSASTYLNTQQIEERKSNSLLCITKSERKNNMEQKLIIIIIYNYFYIFYRI